MRRQEWRRGTQECVRHAKLEQVLHDRRRLPELLRPVSCFGLFGNYVDIHGITRVDDGIELSNR
jgi:hypothetical protein